MIQVIPIIADMEPSYLALLSRGLSDLSVLRLNAAQIEAQINLGIKLDQWQNSTAVLSPDVLWKKQELWLAGKIRFEAMLILEWVLYDPVLEQVVYHERVTAEETQFMGAWVQCLYRLVALLQPPETETELAPVTKSLPAFLEFRRGLEWLAQAKNNRMKEAGLECLLKAVAYDPGYVEAVDLVVLYILQNNQPGDIEYYLNVLERLRRISSHHPRVLLVMAEIYAQMQNLEKTEQLLQETIAEFPDFGEARFRLALHYHGSQQADAALETLWQLLEQDAENIIALDLMGAIYAGNGAREQAKTVWLKVLQLDKMRVNVLNNLGLLSEEGGQLQEAEAYYKKAINSNDQWWGSFYNYGSFCRRQGRCEEAVTWFEKAGKLNPNQFQIFYFWGMTLFDLGRYDEAQDVVLHLIKIAPDNLIRQQSLEMVSRFNLPEIKLGLKLQRLEKNWPQMNSGTVIAQLLKLGKSARRNWLYWYLWGCTARKVNLGVFTKLFWSNGLKYEPGFTLLKDLGMAYWRKKQFQRALPLFEQALHCTHNDRELIEVYLQTLNALGQEISIELSTLEQTDEGALENWPVPN